MFVKLALFSIILFSQLHLACQSENIIIAHSHNDYLQEEPLITAIHQGFQSIEIDIFLRNKKLKVAHYPLNLDSKPTIEQLYLDPLLKASENNISIKWILIDFKNFTWEALEKLHHTVLNYSQLFVSRSQHNGTGPFQIILSGNIPRSDITNNPKYEYFFLDGRISDLDKKSSLKYTPMISANITDYTSWHRNKRLRQDEIKRINSLVDRIHNYNIKLRFWNTDDNEIIWEQLIDLGVDVISVDDLPKFKNYLDTK